MIPPHIMRAIVVYIDDFVLAAKTEENAVFIQQQFDKLCDEVSVLVAHHKSVNATQIATIYRLEFNLKNKTISIPDDKLKKIKQFLILTIEYDFITAVALESLSGKLIYFAQLNTATNALVYNTMALINKLMRQGNLQKLDVLKLPQFVILDLKFWLQFVNVIKTVNMTTMLDQPKISVFASTDASEKTGEFICGPDWGLFDFKH